jgi:hypothetical protein
MRKRLIAALGADGEGPKSHRFDLLPRSLTDRLDRSLDTSGYGIVGNSKNSLDPTRRFLKRCAGTEADEKPIARLLDPLDRNPLEPLAQCCEQLAQKKSAVAALEPQLVVVHDNDWIAHGKFSRLTSYRNF